MSVDGPLAAAYANPGGFVHDTLTVTEAVNLRTLGDLPLRSHGFQDKVRGQPQILVHCTLHVLYTKENTTALSYWVQNGWS